MTTRPKVLIVDDEPEVLALLVGDVEDLGFEVVQAANGRDALDTLCVCQGSGAPVDAVVSDIKMPVMDGLSALAEARKLGFRTPFIFLTGYADKEKAIAVLKLGAIDFFEKPLDRRLMLESLRQAVSLGIELRTLELELDDVMRMVPPGPPEERERLRSAHREVLVLRKAHRAGLKKGKP